MRLLLAICILTLGFRAAADEPLVFASDGGYSPFSFLDSAGEIVGLERSIADALCVRLARACQFELVAWSGLGPGFAEGSHHVVFSGLSALTIHSLGLQPTPPYLSLASRFATFEGRDIPDQAEAMVIGALRGSPHALWLELHLPPDQVKRFPGDEEMVLSLRTGQIDAVFDDGLKLYLSLLPSYLCQEIAISGPAVPLASDGGGLAFALAPDSDLTEPIAEALSAMQRDGTLAALIKLHLPGYATDQSAH